MSNFLIIGFWVIVIIAAIMDIRIKEVKDRYWIIIVVLALLRILLEVDVSLGSHLVGACSFSGIMLLLSVVKQGAFGGGDIKLMFACGLFLGAKVILISAVASILLAGCFVVFRWAIRSTKWRKDFPFVPFLCMGMMIGILFHQQIIDWYLGPLL